MNITKNRILFSAVWSLCAYGGSWLLHFGYIAPFCGVLVPLVLAIVFAPFLTGDTEQ